MIGRGAFQSASKAYREVFWSVWKSKCRYKVDNPKKKKIKHLVAKPEVLEEIREKIFAKKRIFDSEVRNKLDAIGYQEALLPRKEG